MKKLLFGLAALAALMVTARPAAAQYPAPGPVAQAGCQNCAPGYGYGGYGGYDAGWGFGIKDMFLGKLQGLFINYGGGGGRNYNTLPVVDPRTGNAGQLAYPQNPFWRSPRDYFMWDGR